MASLFDAINAAAAALNGNANPKPRTENNEPKVRVQPKTAGSNERVKPKQPTESVKPKVQPKGSTDTAQSNQKSKTDTPKSKGQDFTKLFEGYLRTMIEAHLEKTAKADPAFAAKMKAKGKSIEGCLNYIGGHFYRKAEKQRKSGWVGIGGDDRDLCGMAVHYYDETDEALKAEANS